MKATHSNDVQRVVADFAYLHVVVVHQVDEVRWGLWEQDVKENNANPNPNPLGAQLIMSDVYQSNGEDGEGETEERQVPCFLVLRQKQMFTIHTETSIRTR